MEQDFHFLAHLLGPKAENDDFFMRLASRVIRDYCYWRRNYFPQDPVLLSSAWRRSMEDEYDSIERQLELLLAELRRTFPFYSPRYIAHQQSEVSMTSLLGFMAGILYNPNNVTSESGAVTVDWEIEACGEVMKMLGLVPAPSPPTRAEDQEQYHRKLQAQFGWAHLTSGGTSANIEAMWVARSVRYSVLGFLDAAKELKLDVHVRTPAGHSRLFSSLSPTAALGLQVNEILHLDGRLVEALGRKDRIDPKAAQERLRKVIDGTKNSLGKGYGHVFSKHPPVILASGAAHYSVRKAAEVLGIGRANVEIVDMDDNFRMDVKALRNVLKKVSGQGRVPIAVVGIVGTTEEGAVDPLHSILDVRKEREGEHDQSFWIHVDAAWGGFLRSLFRFKDERPIFEKRLEALWSHTGEAPRRGEAFAGQFIELLAKRTTQSGASTFELCEREGNYDSALNVLAREEGLFTAPPPADDFHLKAIDRVGVVGDFVSDTVEISIGSYKREVSPRWGHWDIAASILAMRDADSITVDPHKLGYTPYPIGLVSFANDLVRRFIAEDAPYITVQDRTDLSHQPPRHLESLDDFGRPRIATLAFAPYTLEGSRPGAAASALLFALRALPLYQEDHGGILRAGLLAARMLQEWLKHWGDAMEKDDQDQEFDLLPLTESAPDTNIVVFVVKKKNAGSLAKCNKLTKLVYSRFSIRAELGERQYSYSQPFFLSSTTMRLPEYSARSLGKFFSRAGIRQAEADYRREGLYVLRAVVQNPYLTPLRKMGQMDLVRDFVMELATAAGDAVKEV